MGIQPERPTTVSTTTELLCELVRVGIRCFNSTPMLQNTLESCKPGYHFTGQQRSCKTRLGWGNSGMPIAP